MSFAVPPRYVLTEKTKAHIAAVFPGRQEQVADLLKHQCGNNLPFLSDADALQLERYRFAVLKLSHGRWHRLVSAVELAKIDWRDLLVAADFAEDPQAHLSWTPEPRTSK